MQPDLQEVFVFKRGGYSINISGLKLYGSPALNEKIANGLASTSVTKPIASKIYHLIYEGTIVPVYSNRGIVSFLKRKVFNPMEEDFISGFWSPSHNKVFLLVDSHTNVFGYASNSVLGRVVIHEMMHMIAHKKGNQFFSTFKPELINFYKSYWTTLFALDKENLKDGDINKILSFLINTFERKANWQESSLKKYEALLKQLKPLSSLKSEQFDTIINYYIATLYIFIKDHMAFGYNYNKPMWQTIYNPLLNTYKQMFSLKPSSDLMLVQELLIPSEVICVMAETKPTPKIYTMIKQF
jgi:hypothetical protein